MPQCAVKLLARAAVQAGRRVLVVDLDPQGNLTSAIAAETIDEDRAGLADALSSRDGARRHRSEPVSGLDVVPTAGVTLGAVRTVLRELG